ncbi:MAG: ribose-phosphate pyrophosphokinase [Betaproteobacteria bacterium]|nr:ribose-phosphate pyrophosphokinase [Betaproteobacteria bacterium]
MKPGGPLVFALQASHAFGAAVAAEAGIVLGAHEERDFPDGEHKARPLESVRERDVYVIQSLHADASRSANDKLLRLLFFIGALRDASAARVTAVVPYLAYARKDQKSKSRDPVTTRYVASFFEAVGTHCVVTLDVHNLAAFQNAFRCRAENLEAAGLLVAHLAPRLGDAEAAVVSPDAGGIKRADRFRTLLAAALGRPVGAAFAEKYRSGGVLTGETLVGDVAGKVAVIVDDLVSAGNTVDRAARACQRGGASRVIAVASHGLFAGEANEVLAASPIERIVVTDTIPDFRLVEPGLRARVERVSTAGLFAQAILRLHEGGSIEALRGR